MDALDLAPIQVMIVAFENPTFTGRIMKELRALRAHHAVRLLDVLFVSKDDDGRVQTMAVNDLTAEERAEFGAIAGAIVALAPAALRSWRSSHRAVSPA